MIISFILMFVVAVYTFIGVFGKKRDIKTRILIAILGTAFGILILIFPLLKDENIVVRTLNAIYFALKSIWMNQDTSILEILDLSNVYEVVYFIVINALFILMPILTTGAILAFLSDIFIKFKLKMAQKKDLYIFSELNEKSEMIAKRLKRTNNCAIIFACSKNRETSIKSVMLEEKITDIKIKNDNNLLTFYAISSDEEENINYALELIHKYKNRANTKIYVVNRTLEAPTILDSVDKGKITVEIINEIEREIYNLLDTKPLYENAINETISVLVVGCGKVGKEFLKTATWCGIMPGYKYKAIVIDIRADEIEENIKVEAPEFLDNYNISFVNADIKSEKAIETIKQVEDINYILVAMENDDKNLEVAILLRRLFLKLYNRKPSISLWIENEYKQEQVTNLVNERNLSYELNAFGSIKDMYYDNIIVDSKIEKLAKQVHLAYSPEDTEFEEYNKREYFKRSSRANALHMKYKIYSILKDNFTNDMKENQKLFKEIYSDEIEDLLIKNEHDRWNAYERSIGYCLASIEKVREYYPETGRHENSLACLHPALVENDELDIISNELKELIPDIDLRYSDKKIVNAMINKIKL